MQTTERQGLKTLEVIVSFDGAVLGVHHLRPGQALRLGPPAAEPSSRKDRPDYALAELQATVALASHGPVQAIVFPTGAAGLVTLADGAARTLGQLREAGLCEEIEGGLRYALPAGARAELSLGAFSVRIAETVLEARTVPATVPVNWRSHRFAAASLLVHAGVLGLAMLMPPDPRALASNDLSRLDNETLRTRFIPAVVELKLTPKETGKDSGGEAPKPIRGAVGRAGSHKVADRSVTTVKDPRPPQRSGLDVQAEVRRQGVLAVMGTNVIQGLLSPLTDKDTSALGKDSDNVLAGLVASADHLGWGENGGHLMQTGGGPGGGCVGPDCGTVAVNLTGICDGGNCNSLERARRTGGGPLTRGPVHHPEGPTTTSGPITTSGGLDKEIVRRVIRSRMNEFKYCYEKELVRSPELAGRVVMSFLISKDGRVVTAVAKESTMASPAVHGCLSQAVQRLSFPMPQGSGLVQVSYPFVFHTAER